MNQTDWQPQPKLIIMLFILVIIIELITPIESVFSYLYILPLLLVNPHNQKYSRLKLSIFASILTILNLFIPGIHDISIITIGNRLIVAMALIITGLLSDRTHYLETKIIEQQIQLSYQEQLTQMRADFVSTLTHDLKTPLLGAIETIKALRKGKFGQIVLAQDKVLEMMMRSHQTSLSLVITMLDIYRNDSEGLLLECQPVNLVNLATESITMLTEFAATRQVYLSLNYGTSDFRRFFWVNGDILELQRVFTNLITNSINHSPRGGKIEIIMESQGDYHIVKISDMGAGIDSEDFSNLFERFYQGYSNRKGKGSGLGLYLSRQIIQAHHGIIWAENLVPQGAVFNFRLPAFSPPNNSI